MRPGFPEPAWQYLRRNSAYFFLSRYAEEALYMATREGRTWKKQFEKSALLLSKDSANNFRSLFDIGNGAFLVMARSRRPLGLAARPCRVVECGSNRLWLCFSDPILEPERSCDAGCSTSTTKTETVGCSVQTELSMQKTRTAACAGLAHASLV